MDLAGYRSFHVSRLSRSCIEEAGPQIRIECLGPGNVVAGRPQAVAGVRGALFVTAADNTRTGPCKKSESTPDVPYVVGKNVWEWAERFMNIVQQLIRSYHSRWWIQFGRAEDDPEVESRVADDR